MFKFVRREVLGDAGDDVASPFPDVPKHAHDVVLLVKLYMSSGNVAQAPVVVLPHVFLSLLPDQVSAMPNLRSPLSESQ